MAKVELRIHTCCCCSLTVATILTAIYLLVSFGVNNSSSNCFYTHAKWRIAQWIFGEWILKVDIPKPKPKPRNVSTNASAWPLAKYPPLSEFSAHTATYRSSTSSWSAWLVGVFPELLLRVKKTRIIITRDAWRRLQREKKVFIFVKRPVNQPVGKCQPSKPAY